MSNELVHTDIKTITAEIKMLKEQTAQNIIEIGKRLIQAKEKLQHGDWLPWLENEVDFTQRTAQRFMKVSQEFGNTTSMSHLGSGKLFSLLSLPAEKRETFIKENPVNEMTTRELQAAIRAKKEADRKVAELEKQNKIAAEQNMNSIGRIYRLEEELDELKKHRSGEVIKEVEKEVVPNDYIEMKARVERFEKMFNDQNKKSVVELSGLVMKIEDLLQNELAPVKYSKAIAEQHDDEKLSNNLKEIVFRVRNWCDEMDDLLENKEFVNAEVVNCE